MGPAARCACGVSGVAGVAEGIRRVVDTDLAPVSGWVRLAQVGHAAQALGVLRGGEGLAVVEHHVRVGGQHEDAREDLGEVRQSAQFHGLVVEGDAPLRVVGPVGGGDGEEQVDRGAAGRPLAVVALEDGRAAEVGGSYPADPGVATGEAVEKGLERGLRRVAVQQQFVLAAGCVHQLRVVSRIVVRQRGCLGVLVVLGRASRERCAEPEQGPGGEKSLERSSSGRGKTPAWWEWLGVGLAGRVHRFTSESDGSGTTAEGGRQEGRSVGGRLTWRDDAAGLSIDPRTMACTSLVRQDLGTKKLKDLSLDESRYCIASLSGLRWVLPERGGLRARSSGPSDDPVPEPGRRGGRAPARRGMSDSAQSLVGPPGTR
ncbi:hypothetical protein SGPA1_40633 [Streptomyces misionensis JCM 4497]